MGPVSLLLIFFFLFHFRSAFDEGSGNPTFAIIWNIYFLKFISHSFQHKYLDYQQIEILIIKNHGETQTRNMSIIFDRPKVQIRFGDAQTSCTSGAKEMQLNVTVVLWGRPSIILFLNIQSARIRGPESVVSRHLLRSFNG